MPEIWLPERGVADASASAFRVPMLAVMLYPRLQDSKRRDQWLAAAYCGAYVQWLEIGAPEHFLASYHRWLPGLWQLRQAPEAAFNTGLRRMSKAVLSGELLSTLLACARHHPRHFTVERVRALVSHLNRHREHGSSESLLAKVWPEFRPVSHLWMSWLSCRATWQGSLLDDQQVLRELMVSEVFREQAEECGIFKADEAWRPPAWVEGPDEVNVPIEPLATESLDWLNQQFPI